jgi:hypothetical protein
MELIEMALIFPEAEENIRLPEPHSSFREGDAAV